MQCVNIMEIVWIHPLGKIDVFRKFQICVYTKTGGPSNWSADIHTLYEVMSINHQDQDGAYRDSYNQVHTPFPCQSSKTWVSFSKKSFLNGTPIHSPQTSLFLLWICQLLLHRVALLSMLSSICCHCPRVPSHRLPSLLVFVELFVCIVGSRDRKICPTSFHCNDFLFLVQWLLNSCPGNHVLHPDLSG